MEYRPCICLQQTNVSASALTFESFQAKLHIRFRESDHAELEGHLWMAFTPPSSLHLPSTWVFRLGTLLGTPSMRGLLPCLLGCLLHRDSRAQGEWQHGAARNQEPTSNASTAFFLGSLKEVQR